MSDLAMWAVVTGTIVPFFVALVNQAHWSAAFKAIVTAIVCVLVASVEVFFKFGWSLHNWTHSVLLVFFTAIATYHLWWKPSGIAPGVEVATSK